MTGPDNARFTQLLTEIAIIDQLASAATQRLLPAGLSLAGFRVLNHLERLPGDWGPARLARAFQVTKGAMTNTLQRLEAAGCITHEADPADGRSHHVRLTAAGRATHADALARMAPHVARMAAAMPADLVEAALPALVRLRTWLDSNRLPTQDAGHD
jgi:DNA-binding MarR family transcriptional regulator